MTTPAHSHVEGMVADGDQVPRWLLDGSYRFEWELTPAAISAAHSAS